MHLRWNVVTWYSKLAALVVFGAVLAVGVFIGRQHEGWRRDLDDLARSEDRLPVVARAKAAPSASALTPATVAARPYAWFEEGDMIRYVNTDIGVEFSYPKKFGTPSTAFQDYSAGGEDEYNLGPVSGKRYVVEFGDINFYASTKDYQRFLQDNYTGAEPIEKLCAKGDTADQWPLCGLRTFGARRALLAVSADNLECSYGGLVTSVRFQNDGPSPYAGLEFSFTPKDASAAAGKYFDCVDEAKAMLYADDAATQVRHIFDGTGLSKRDASDLRDYYAVISSVRTSSR